MAIQIEWIVEKKNILHVDKQLEPKFLGKRLNLKRKNVQNITYKPDPCLNSGEFFYHDEACEQIDPAMLIKTVESVYNTLGLELGQTWESYLTELPKFLWTTIFLTSLELENYDKDMKERVLYALYYGPCGLKTNDLSSVEIHKDDNTEQVMNVDPIKIQCPENVFRKEEEPMDLELIINDVQNKFYF